jgi:hypothetical protein
LAKKHMGNRSIFRVKDADISTDTTYRVSGVRMLTLQQYLSKLSGSARKQAEQAFDEANLKLTWTQSFRVIQLNSIVDEYLRRHRKIVPTSNPDEGRESLDPPCEPASSSQDDSNNADDLSLDHS